MYKAWRSQETLTLPAGLHVWNSAPNVQIGKNSGPEQIAMRMRYATRREGGGGEGRHIPNRERTSVVHCELQKCKGGRGGQMGV